MTSHGVGGGQAKAPPSTPVKWTLVEAEPETPEGRRSKQQGNARRGQGASGGSGSSGNWRSARDAGRGRGGGQGFSSGHRGQRRGGGGGGGGGARNSQGQGRGRGYGGGGGGGGGGGVGGGGYAGGATYYGSPNSEHASFEEQKAYMTNMAVKQIEFYFTVENLCRDIFMRSYMDEEGYIPIAFVANFPGVARIGVELQDIAAGILASDTLQVDTENETMRMREGWEVWLLPNQATGKQGVPRYIKVDPETESSEPSEPSTGEDGKPGEDGNETGEDGKAIGEDEKEASGDPEETAKKTERSGEDDPEVGHEADGTPDAGDADGCETKALTSPSNGASEGGTPALTEASERVTEVEDTAVPEEAVVEAVVERADVCSAGEDQTEAEMKKELTPTAPAWTPESTEKTDDAQEQESHPESSPAAAPPGDR